VSSDRDDDAFAGYHGSMPWLALPFADRERKGALSKRFKVQGIPSLVIVDGDTSETINGEARGAVGEHGAKAFPWHPPTLRGSIAGKKLVRCPGAKKEEAPVTIEDLEATASMSSCISRRIGARPAGLSRPTSSSSTTSTPRRRTSR